MPAHRRWWVGIVSLLFAGRLLADEPHYVPGPVHRGDYLGGHDFRLTPIVARDPSGEPITDMPAYRFGFRDTDGNWQETEADKPVDITVPPALRERLMLVFNGGWELMPRGWRPAVATLTANSTLSIEFTAPGGFSQGWLSEGMEVGAWEAMSDAAPFFPLVRKEMLAMDFAQPGQRFPLPHHVVSLTRPDACTVIYDYVERGSPGVHAWINFVGISNGELYVFDMAMPEADKAVRDAVFANHTTAQAPCPPSRQRASR